MDQFQEENTGTRTHNLNKTEKRAVLKVILIVDKAAWFHRGTDEGACLLSLCRDLQHLHGDKPLVSDPPADEQVARLVFRWSTLKPDMPFTMIMKEAMPVISDLGDGWFLVAHPKGPAIANADCLVDLSSRSTETGITPGKVESPVPEWVREKAVEAFERVAWPLMREQFYEEKP